MNRITIRILRRIMLISLAFLYFQAAVVAQNYKIATISLTQNISDSIHVVGLEGYSVFLHGEMHTNISSPKLKMDFLKYYYENAQTRNLLIELGYASGFLINKYLETGNEKYVCKGLSFYPYQEYRTFLRALYAFNNTVKEKIRVVGIDDNERICTWFNAMEVLFENTKYKESTLNPIASKVIELSKAIQDPLSTNYDSIYTPLAAMKRTLISDYKAQSDVYKKLLGDDFIHFKLIIDHDKSMDRNKNTNKFMVENLIEIIAVNGVNEGTYFGQFGSAHILNNHRSFSNLLNKSTLFKDSVLTVMPYYENCVGSYVEFKNQKIITSKFPIKANDVKLYKIPNKELSTNNVTLVEVKPMGRIHYILYIKNQNELEFKPITYCKPFGK